VGSTVLHVIDNMNLGGAQRIVSTVVDRKQSHYLHSLRKAEQSMGDFGNYSVTNSRYPYSLDCLIDCWREIRKINPDVLHCHLIKSKIIGIFLKKFCGLEFKLVLHEHGEIWKEDNRLYERILSYSSRIVDRHIAVSKHTSNLLNQKSDIPSCKIDVIYNFVDRQKYNKSQLKSFDSCLNTKTRRESFKVGYAGRLESRKGWKSVISAAKENKEIEFLVSGLGNGKNRLMKEDRETKNLHYLGFLEDVRMLFANIDCFLLPSHWDPSPMVLYEVQSCGIPLICTDVKSIDELIEPGENALTFPSRDKDALSQKLAQLEQNPNLRNKLAEEGVENSKKYDFKAFEESIENTYSDMID
jgi:glycosyltransferase involved in cell wall biosynthesis